MRSSHKLRLTIRELLAMFKILALLVVLTPFTVMADNFQVGPTYRFPPGLTYCDKDAIENEVDMLNAGIVTRISGCYETSEITRARLIKNFPELGYSKWIFLLEDSWYITYYFPNALIY